VVVGRLLKQRSPAIEDAHMDLLVRRICGKVLAESRVRVGGFRRPVFFLDLAQDHNERRPPSASGAYESRHHVFNRNVFDVIDYHFDGPGRLA